jgi:hypothetical protein
MPDSFDSEMDLWFSCTRGFSNSAHLDRSFKVCVAFSFQVHELFMLYDIASPQSG